MKRNRISKANHKSKNYAIIVADIDIALLIADKNKKTTEIHHKNTENQGILFIHT